MEPNIGTECDDLGIQLSISLMCISLTHVQQDITSALADGIRSTHIDIVEPDWGSPAMSLRHIGDLRKTLDVSIDVHLMVSDPSKYIDQAFELGADRVMMPYQHTIDIYGPDMPSHPPNIVPVFESSAARSGIHYKPRQSLVMSVVPGDAGRPFRPDAIDTVEKIHEIAPQAPIISDGAVSPKTGRILYSAGATEFVIGSTLLPNRRYSRDSILQFCRALKGH